MRSIRLFSALAIVVLAGLFLAPPALAAYTYQRGETVSLGFSSLPSSYTAYWTSDKDGFLARGNPLRTSALSAGLHTITVQVYRNRDNAVVYRTTVEVDIQGAATTPAPTPQPSQSSGTYAPGEFEPVTTLLLGTNDAYSVEDMYPEFLDALRGVVSTTIYVDNDYVAYELEDIFASYGVDDADYEYVTVPVDSIWMRDYGPLFAKKNGKLEVVDLLYYPGRPYDDQIPRQVARELGVTNKPLRVYWEGGNFTADGKGRVFASDRVYTANSGSQSSIASAVGAAFYGTLNVLDHMLNDGGTQHLDMFALFLNASTVMVNKFPASHQNGRRLDQNAARLESMGYRAVRVDNADSGFSSYTNGLIVNDVALVPTYGRSSADAKAIAAYRAAGYRTVTIDCRRIIQWSGAIHCITITVPR